MFSIVERKEGGMAVSARLIPVRRSKGSNRTKNAKFGMLDVMGLWSWEGLPVFRGVRLRVEGCSLRGRENERQEFLIR